MLLRALLALLLTVAPASAQFIFSGGGSGGSGTVTTLSVATVNGFAGTVATATTTPVITLTTSVTGNVCSNATALSACSTTGTGATVLASTPTLVTPVLGVASGTSLALGGATIGTNVLAVTGTVAISGLLTITQATANAGILASTGYSLTGSNATSMVDLAGTWNTSGTPTGLKFYITNTASNAASKVFDFGLGANSHLQLRALTANTSTLVVGADSVNFNSNGNTTYYRGALIGWNSDAGSSLAASIDTSISRNAAGITQFSTNAANAAGGWLAAKGTLTGGTLADQGHPFVITATQPASPSTEQDAILWTITSAGSASQVNVGLYLNYAAGYTGSSNSTGINVDNSAAGTAAVLIPASGTPSGNVGLSGTALATTVGTNMGQMGFARGGNVNSGLVGVSNTNKAGALNIGVSGAGINAGGGGALQIGGFFSLNQTTVPTVSAALIADNGAQTDAIFLARLAGVTKVSVEGSAGNLVVSTATDSTTTTSGSVQIAGGVAIRKRIFADGLTASAGLQTAVICQSSAGELIADSVACLASSARFKTILGAAEPGALDKLMSLPIYRWKYNKEGIFSSDEWTRERIGPTAEETAKIDPRLVGYDSEGQVRNISTEQLLSLTIQAVQELKADNDNLRATMNKRAANGG